MLSIFHTDKLCAHLVSAGEVLITWDIPLPALACQLSRIVMSQNHHLLCSQIRDFLSTPLSLEKAQGRVTLTPQWSQPCANILLGNRYSAAMKLSCHLAQQPPIYLFHTSFITPSSVLSDCDTVTFHCWHCRTTWIGTALEALLCKRLSWTTDSAAQAMSTSPVTNKFRIIMMSVTPSKIKVFVHYLTCFGKRQKQWQK